MKRLEVATKSNEIFMIEDAADAYNERDFEKTTKMLQEQESSLAEMMKRLMSVVQSKIEKTNDANCVVTMRNETNKCFNKKTVFDKVRSPDLKSDTSKSPKSGFEVRNKFDMSQILICKMVILQNVSKFHYDYVISLENIC